MSDSKHRRVGVLVLEVPARDAKTSVKCALEGFRCIWVQASARTQWSASWSWILLRGGVGRESTGRVVGSGVEWHIVTSYFWKIALSKGLNYIKGFTLENNLE